LRVLIVRIGAMGDVLHAMPAVAALRARHPDWFIGWAIEPQWSDLLQIAGDPNDLQQIEGRNDGHALVDRWYSVPARTWKRRLISLKTRSEIHALRDVLQNDRFDVCVDMQGALKSAMVGRMAWATVFAGPAAPRERLARWFYKQQVEMNSAHVVEQGCELLGAAVSGELHPARVTLPMDEMDERWATEQVGCDRFCLISPGGGWGAKIWPAERFGQVAAELARAGVQTVVNTSPQGSSDADLVVQASNGSARVGDTGPLHLAAALQRPVVGIYGPTDPARNGPYGTRSRVLRDAVSQTSHKRVREVDAGMLRIGVDEVVAAAMEMLG